MLKTEVRKAKVEANGLKSILELEMNSSHFLDHAEKLSMYYQALVIHTLVLQQNILPVI